MAEALLREEGERTRPSELRAGLRQR